MTRTRSIGARSDWSEKTNGETTDGDADGDDPQTNGAARQWTIYREDGDPNVGMPGYKAPGEDDPDDPINKFVQDQLARIKSNESHEFSEELAAQTDGANEEL
jgi:hypothetical protein